MTELEPWVARYRRAVLDHLGAPDDVDLSTVVISTSWSEAGGYSEYTNWDAEIEMTVAWTATEDGPNYGWGPNPRRGERTVRALSNSEVAELINSFG